MSKLLFDVELSATVKQWLTVEAESEDEARTLALAGDSIFPISEEVMDAEIVHIELSFDQMDDYEDDEDWEDDTEPQWID